MQINWKPGPENCPQIDLPISKSIVNRMAIIHGLAKTQLMPVDSLESEDLKYLFAALSNRDQRKNLGMSGTAMRFLTAYFAIQESSVVILSGDDRLLERPVKPLVRALQELGAEIEYLDKEGFPPLKISGKKLEGGSIEIDGSISSQFISALLLIAPYMDKGLSLKLRGEVVSRPYLSMTIELIRKASIVVEQDAEEIVVHPGKYANLEKIELEKDWSSAAFFYQYLACSTGGELLLKGLKTNSIQGDKRLIELYTKLGVSSRELPEGILLSKTKFMAVAQSFDMLDCPDLIPSFAVAASFILPKVEITGVQTLRLKESDRVLALKTELGKLGIILEEIGRDKINLERKSDLPSAVEFDSHNDHRMAMALAMLATEMSQIKLAKPEVVSKSFPHFYREIQKLGFFISAKN